MNAHTLATDLILQDLFDCLLAEDVFALMPVTLAAATAEHPAALQPAAPEERLWECCCDPREQRFIAARVRPGITQAWVKVPGTPILARQGDAWSTLTPDAFVTLVFAQAAADPEQARGIALLRETLATRPVAKIPHVVVCKDTDFVAGHVHLFDALDIRCGRWHDAHLFTPVTSSHADQVRIQRHAAF